MKGMRRLDEIPREGLIEIILEQAAHIRKLEKRIEQLEAEIARLKKDSSTSSKRPSSDIEKPKKKPPCGKKGKKRKIGGQPGHPRHGPRVFSEEQVDRYTRYTLDRCPECGGELQWVEDHTDWLQQISLPPTKPEVVEHQGLAYWCRRCKRIHYGKIPPEIKRGGLFDVELTALVGFLKGRGHVSYTTIGDFLESIWRLPVSRGFLAKVVQRVSEALKDPYEFLQEELRFQRILNVDETGHKDNGDRLWTWCFRSSLFTFFRIDPSRGSSVLLDTLGEEFNGVLGCDYFSAYRKYMRECGVLVQFCLAHLIRDVKFLTTLPQASSRRYGRRLLESLKDLFGVIHRREEMTERGFQRALSLARNRTVGMALQAPKGREAQNLAKRFREHGESYFEFITTPGIEPTNNLAEQAIRFVVIDRKVTQGTRSEKGRRWNERIWTVLATCAQQGRSVYEYLVDALRAHWKGAPAPPLSAPAPT